MSEGLFDPDWRPIAVFATRASEAEVRAVVLGADQTCECRLREQVKREGDDRRWFWFDMSRRKYSVDAAVKLWFEKIRPALGGAFQPGDPRKVHLSVQ